MAKSKRLNRTTDMDNALFEALNTPVPEKDTGPDPDDILAGLFDEDDKAEEVEADSFWQQIDNSGNPPSSLDDVDQARAAQIMEAVREQTGLSVDLTEAIKIALHACPLDEQVLVDALEVIRTRSKENG